MNKSNNKPCRFGSSCSFKMNCKWFHSEEDKLSWAAFNSNSKPQVNEAIRSLKNQVNEAISINDNSPTLKVKCWFNMTCFDVNCRNSHDSEFICNTFKNGYCSTIGCQCRHPRDCRTANKCNNRECQFRHSNAFCNNNCIQFPCLNRHEQDLIDDLDWNIILDQFRKEFQPRSLSKTTPEMKINNLRKRLVWTLIEHDKIIKIASVKFSKSFNVHVNTVNGEEKENARLQAESLEQTYNETVEQKKGFCVCVKRHFNAYLNSKLNFQMLTHALNREMFRLQKNRLPALALRSKFDELMLSEQILIVRGQTGSGKSTQLTQYLSELTLVDSKKKIICTQPRKIAAVSLATRVAFEYGFGAENNEKTSPVGRYVGYEVGGRSLVSKKSTIIEYITEEKFLNLILSRKLNYNDIYAIVVDEAHERSINTDIIMGILKSEILNYPHLKVVITSATLDPKIFSQYFYNCKTLEIPGKTYPVDIIYSPPDNDNADMSAEVVKKALFIHLDQPVSAGDILCFLTGQEEVEKAKIAFLENEKLFKNEVEKSSLVLTAYGKQTPEDQQELFRPVSKANTRKIIFATDVAETSITIDGVRFVVDSGLKKDVLFDAKRNMSSLQVMAISQSSAIQRKGRAGRTSSGTCIRLYSQQEYDSMPEGVVPELQRVPLANTVVNLIKMGLDPFHFGWLDPPEPESIKSAVEELKYLGAIVNTNKLSQLGDYIAETQLSPGAAKMIFESCQTGMGIVAIKLASIVQMSSIFYWHVPACDQEKRAKAETVRSTNASEFGDVIGMFNFYEKYENMIEKKNFVKQETTMTNSSNNDLILEKFKIDEESLNLQHYSERLNPNADEEYEDIDNENALSTISLNMSEIKDFDDQQSDCSLVDNEDADELEELNKENQEENEINQFLNRNKTGLEIQAWLRENFISQKALSLIRSNVKLIEKTTKKFIPDVWSLSVSQDKKPKEECDLSHILFNSMFLNYAVKINNNQYLALRSNLIGRIHPGSDLKKLNIYPDQICYLSLLKLNTVMFVNPIACKREWLDKIANSEFRNILERKAPVKLTIENIAFSFLSKFGGKNLSNLRQFEKDYDCLVELDYTSQTATVWKSSDLIYRVKEELEKQIMSMKNEALQEIEEIELNTKTSYLVGVGGELVNILFEGEFSALVFRGISSSASALKLKQILNSHGNLKTMKIMNDQSNAVGKCVAYAMFSDPISALEAKIKFDNDYIDSCQIKCESCGILKPKSFKDCSAQLKFFYSQGVSKGEAYVGFCNAKTANKAISMAMVWFKEAKVQPIGIVQPFSASNLTNIPNKPILTNDKKLFLDEQPLEFRNFKVKITGIDKNLTELDLKRRFLSNNIKTWSVVIIRDENKMMKLNCSLIEYEAYFNEIIPFSQKFKPTLCEFKNEKSLLSGFIVTYSMPEHAQVTFEAIKDTKLNIEHLDIQVEADFSGTYSLHSELYKSFKENIDDLIDEYSRKPNIITINKKETLDNNKQSKVIFFIRSYNLDEIRVIQSKLEDAIKFEIYENSDINLLFTNYGREQMQMISKSKSYLHWDNRSRTIRIYANNREDHIQIKSILDNLLVKLKSIEIDKCFILNKIGVDYFKNINDENKFLSQNKILNLSKLNRIIKVTGTKESIMKFEGDFRKYFNTQNVKNRVAVNKNKECAFCLCDLTNPFSLMSCAHTACENCFSDMIRSQANLPIVCQYENCNQPIFLTDLKRLCANNKETLRKINEKAFYDYLEKNMAKFRRCPKNDCNQIVRLTDLLIAKDKGEERKNGGCEIMACNICEALYCMYCSNRKKKPCFLHYNILCNDFCSENDFSGKVEQYTKEIIELLYNKCPNCHAIFDSFTGCCAVTCDNCKCSFCGICVEFHSNDAHSHVANCPKNPQKGQLFLSDLEIKDVEKQRKLKIVDEYIKKINNNSLGDVVRKASRKFLDF